MPSWPVKEKFQIHFKLTSNFLHRIIESVTKLTTNTCRSTARWISSSVNWENDPATEQLTIATNWQTGTSCQLHVGLYIKFAVLKSPPHHLQCWWVPTQKSVKLVMHHGLSSLPFSQFLHRIKDTWWWNALIAARRRGFRQTIADNVLFLTSETNFIIICHVCTSI